MLSRIIKYICCAPAFFVAAWVGMSLWGHTSPVLAGQSGIFSIDNSGKSRSEVIDPSVVASVDPEIREHVPDAQLVGQGRLSVFIWDVYDSFLYAPDGKWQQDQPFALKLIYLRRLYGDKIAERSIEEIRQQGFEDEERLSLWGEQMGRIFPDVDEGVSLTGIYTANGRSIFFLDNQEIGAFDDPEFGRQFFGIWLSEKTSQPDLRQKLLGVQ